MDLTTFDRQLLDVIQNDLPMTNRPFADLAAKLGADEKTVLERINLLRRGGWIHRIGAFFDAENLGYKGVLVAVAVEAAHIQKTAEFINSCPAVTHNDERDHDDFQLWFTVQTTGEAELEEILARLRKQPGVGRMVVLPTSRRHKVNVKFQLGQGLHD
jgi:DNA-binding Lrp family transcriptional regulator